MVKYFLYRILLIPMIILGVVTIVFLILRLSGDPVSLFVGMDATLAEIEEVREEMGFNDPIIVQYVKYLGDVIHLDFGNSMRYGVPAFNLLLKRFPATLELAFCALLISIFIGIPLGIVSALKQGTVWDIISSTIALIGQGAPVFWIGVMFILLFSVKLKLLPATGAGGIKHLVLPGFTLGFFFAARVVRITRAAILDEIVQQYLWTARAKGADEKRVFTIHIAKNAAISVITIIGLSIPSLVGGAVMTEAIFNWPGIAGFIVTAVYNRDYAIVQAGVVILAIIVALTNIVVDVLYCYLDPRVKIG